MLKRPKVANQKAVALESGVSRSTVGAILSGGALALRYNEETRKKVLAAAAKLNYRPSRAAQAMRKQRSNLIAIVHFGAGIEAAHKANLSLSRELNVAGYDYLAVDMNWHGGSVERTLSELIQARVEGVLISHIQEVFAEEQIEVLHRAGIPVVSINGQRRSGVPLICDDVSASFSGLTRHLLELGHRLILNLTSSAAHLSDIHARSVSQRVEGFRQTVEANGTWRGMTEEEFFAEWPTLTSDGVLGITVHQEKRLYEQLNQPVYRFCQRLFTTGKLPDGIVCANDSLALEAILAGQERGIRVPQDFALTGYDNDCIGAFPAIGLTTAEQDIEKICKRGVETLLNLIRDPNYEAQDQVFSSRLILRTSSGHRQRDPLVSSALA